jgi:hypothetical protein
LRNARNIQTKCPKISRNAMEDTKWALDDFAILLGVKKPHVKANLQEYLKIVKKEVFGESGAVVEYIIRGIEKLKKEDLFTSAWGDFKKAIGRDKTQW